MIRRKKQLSSARTGKSDCSIRPEGFVLCERSSGTVRFRVNAEPGGKLPVDQMAGLVAMHCLVRGQAPEDFEVMVVTQEPLHREVAARAERLLAAGRALGVGVKISRREQQVLEGITQNLGNKEIASRLHVAERTVKFHVSSLLAKYGVSDRVALSRGVLMARAPAAAYAGPSPPQTLFGYPVGLREGRIANVAAPAGRNSADGVAGAGNQVLAVVPRQRFAT